MPVPHGRNISVAETNASKVSCLVGNASLAFRLHWLYGIRRRGDRMSTNPLPPLRLLCLCPGGSSTREYGGAAP